MLRDVAADALVFARERHAQEQGIPGLLTDGALSVHEGDEQREDQEPACATCARLSLSISIGDNGHKCYAPFAP